jgi:hypothetical protein
MLKRTMNVPIYDWKIILWEIESDKDVAETVKLCKKLKFSQSDINEYEQLVLKNLTKWGFCQLSYSKRTTWIVASTKDSRERCNIMSHEIRHAVDFLFEFLQIDDTEASAYLTGYISEKLC